MNAINETVVLSTSLIEKVEKEATKYPTRRAAVKSALRYAQAEHGWITEDVVKAVASLLALRPIEVFEVATFYDMFYTQPVGSTPFGCAPMCRACSGVRARLLTRYANSLMLNWARLRLTDGSRYLKPSVWVLVAARP